MGGKEPFGFRIAQRVCGPVAQGQEHVGASYGVRASRKGWLASGAVPLEDIGIASMDADAAVIDEDFVHVGLRPIMPQRASMSIRLRLQVVRTAGARG